MDENMAHQYGVPFVSKLIPRRSMFSKATRSHNVQILGRGFLWYALIRIVLEMNAAPTA